MNEVYNPFKSNVPSNFSCSIIGCRICTTTESLWNGICAAISHPTDKCPTLQDESCEHASLVGGFLRIYIKELWHCLNTYNQGWKDHPNFSFEVRPQFQQF